jgi:hypothetical protein
VIEENEEDFKRKVRVLYWFVAYKILLSAHVGGT